MINQNFIHLKIHSDFSIVDGLIKIEDIIKTAANLNMPALALTDNMNIFGMIKFYNLACKYGIKPIIGTDILLVDNLFKLNKLLCFKITILVINNNGFTNLKLLISKCYQHPYYDNYGPILERKWLTIFNDGLIILSGSINGDIGKMLLTDNHTMVNNYLKFWKTYFFNNYYFELTRTNNLLEEKYINLVLKLSVDNKIPVVATNNIYFLNKNDFDLHSLKLNLLTNQKNLILYNTIYNTEQYFKNQTQIINLFKNIPQAITNTIEIAKRCNLIIKKQPYHLPSFFDNPKLNYKYLIKYAKKSLIKYLIKTFSDKDLRQQKLVEYNLRLKQELNVINKTNFQSYFLIVKEIIDWAKQQSIPVGPGRGSVSGSLVAYLLNITNVDPIKFGLFFERFLNLERISLPDIDLDFCVKKRDLVIKHIMHLYGKKSVSQIITFGKMGIKVAFKDIGRMLSYPHYFINYINNLLPTNEQFTIDEIIIRDKSLNAQYYNDPIFYKLIMYIKKIYGIVRHVGTHAGGIVISFPKLINDFTAIYYDKSFKPQVTQFDKNSIEYIGLVKFDLLGLKTLTIINETVKLINKFLPLNQNNNLININNIYLNDQKCFDLLKQGKTTAVFQLESNEIKEVIKRLQPNSFDDITALLALYRPGPLDTGLINNYINRKHGKEPIYYPEKDKQHYLLKPILKSTYGIILFQEQVMQIAQTLAGYSLGEADILRKAMGSKNQSDLSAQRDIFCEKAYQRGINKDLSNKIFDFLENFGKYGFNKAHSVAYSILTYQTLWLKTYYPTEFLISVMNLDLKDSNKIKNLLLECKLFNINIILPNINLSHYKFFIKDKSTFIYGLGAIKGINKNILKNILKERLQNGKFTNFYQLCNRLFLCSHNKQLKLYFNCLLKLIYAGSLDIFEKNRNKLLKLLEHIWQFLLNKYLKGINNKQLCYLNEDKLILNKIFKSNKKILPWAKNNLLNKELISLGYYCTEHPTLQYKEEIKLYTNNNFITDVIKNKINYEIIKIAGLVIDINYQKLLSKNKYKVVFITIQDFNNQIKLTLSNDDYYKFKLYLKKYNFIILTLSKYYNRYSSKLTNFKVININTFNEVRKKFLKKIILILYSHNISIININVLKNILIQSYIINKNKLINILIDFWYIDKNIKVILKTILPINPTINFIDILISLLGKDQVKLIF